MTISYNWLSEYLPVKLAPERLATILTSIGLEVESMADSEVKRIVPCSYEDYFRAAQGDLPNRWILTQALLG